MEKILQATNVVKSYNKKEVLHAVTLAIEPGHIYGLLGRNGAGKTTLLSVLTAQNPHDAGEVTYGGERVWENEAVLGELCFSRELSPMILFGQNTLKVKEYLRAASVYYPHWDHEYAERLCKLFALDKKAKICKLSKGMLSMVTIVIALASRAPITMLDEPVAVLDVVAREQFYDLLLRDYAETGRTFIVSTHIIEEAATALEKVIVINEGRILAVEDTQALVAQFHLLSGKDTDVDAAAKGLEVLHSESFGRSKTVCVRGSAAAVEAGAAQHDVDLSPVSLQKAFVYLTGGPKEDAVC